MRARGQRWVDDSLVCLSGAAGGSGASHAAEIVANEQGEYQLEWDSLLRMWQGYQPGRAAAGTAELVRQLRETCERKRRETLVEFHYNVVFEHGSGPEWGAPAGEWDLIESALSSLPDEAVWGNPLVLRFRREACHPGDVDAAGACVGQATGGGTGFVGGETQAVTAREGRVSVYGAGLGSAPYSRSASLQLPATLQTIAHEMGHVVDAQLGARLEDFFENVVGWRQYSWGWVSTAGSPYPSWQAERARLRAELGMNDAQLTTWLAGLAPGVPVTVAGRRYERGTSFLSSIVPGNIPTGREFEYARTNRGDYFAEIYALAASRPAFLHAQLPSAQISWLKTNVFHTPATEAELRAEVRNLAVDDPSPVQERYVAQGRLLFSRRQLDALLGWLLTERRGLPGSGVG